MDTCAVKVVGLKKSYGTTEAVKGINLEIPTGTVFALLGPNGAGKTTTVEILEGHRKRNAGIVSVLGYDPDTNARSFKQRIGIVLQETGVEPYLTVEETIKLFAGYYDQPRSVYDILEATGLIGLRQVRAQKLSGGQRRRLDVAIGLVGNPDLLFLDEPTTGFDPAARHDAWSMIRNLRNLGKTIFLTTHYMDEVEYLADQVAIMVSGKIVAEGSPSELAAKSGETRIRFHLYSSRVSLPDGMSYQEQDANGFVTLYTKTPVRTLFDLTTWSIHSKNTLQDISVSPPSLEDIYLDLVKEPSLD